MTLEDDDAAALPALTMAENLRFTLASVHAEQPMA